MKQAWKKAAAFLLTLSLVLSGQMGQWGAAVMVKGASVPISRIDQDQILDARYKWQAKFISGKTKARQIRCDNIYADQYLKGPGGDWGTGATEGVASLPEGDRTFSEEEAPGCYYSNVGEVKLADGSIHTMDLQVTITASYGGKSRYDYRTPSLMTTNPEARPESTSLNHITYSWQEEMGRPCVSFMKNSIGLRVYCVDGVDVKFTYLDHQTGEPLVLNGHGTLGDIDGLQSVSFPEDSHIRQVYLLKESEGHLEISDHTIYSSKTSLSEDSRKGDITYLFDNTSTVSIHFSYQKSLEQMTANYEKSLAQAGSREKLAEILKKRYYGSNQETLMPHYQGEEWVTSHAAFSYTSKVVGRFVEEPSEELAKKIGEAGCTWESARAAEKEDPHWMQGETPFDYLVRYELKPSVLDSFVLEDVLPEGLIIEGRQQVTVYDKKEKEVSSLFDISVEQGRRITCAATEEALAEETFSDAQVYTFRFRVHRQPKAEVVLEEDQYTFLLPNRATLRMRYENPAGNREEKTFISNEVWAGGRITPSLQIEKRASRYEWQVGERVDYTVKVTQVKQDAWAQNLVISDTDLPEGLVLQDDFTVESQSPTEHFVIAREGENGWQCTGPLLRYDESVILHFSCLVTEEANGREWQNYAYAQAENHVDEATGEQKEPVFAREEIWVNSPRHEVQKMAAHYEWQVGEQVDYTVTVAGAVPGTLARDVVISDEMLPPGLRLVGGPEGIQMEGIPTEAAIPERDDHTGMNLSHKEPVEYELQAAEGGWRLWLNYLPGGAMVKLHFRCLIEGDPSGKTPQKMGAPANGSRASNQVTVTAENSCPQEEVEEEEIYVNTACLLVEKTADIYEWQVGESVRYAVQVENQYPGTIARNLVLSDMELPAGLTLQPEGITVEGIPEKIQQPVPGKPGEEATEEKEVLYELTEAENGWRLTISDLPAEMPVTVWFSCVAEEAVNGQEAVNTASVQADNGVLRQDDARIYVNTAHLSVRKEVRNSYAAGGEQDKKDGRLPEEFRVGEEVIYQVTVENLQPGSIARNLRIEDVKLPAYLALCELGEITVEGIPAEIEEPAEVTEDPANETNPQYYQETRRKQVSSSLEEAEDGWQLQISDLPEGMPVQITYHCLVKEAANGKEILNEARAWADNGAEARDEKKIWINTPKLILTKQPDRGTYVMGDTLTYQVRTEQTAVGCVARSVLIEDVVQTAGAKLSKSTVVVLDETDQVIDCDIAVEENAFAASTGRNLVARGGYVIWDGTLGEECLQEAWNPLGEAKETRLCAEYAVEITDQELAGKTVDNLARVTSMEGYPQEVTVQVPILAPELQIEKSCDKKEYHVGEVVYYQIRIEQIREQVAAKAVCIRDSWDLMGMELVPETLVAAKDQKPLKQVKITVEEQGFLLESGIDLEDKEVLEVHYQMIVRDPALAEQTVKNTATAQGSNTAEVTDTEEIHLLDIRPVLEITKTSDQEVYEPGDTGSYEVRVSQVRADAVARNVIIRDDVISPGARILPETLAVKNSHGNLLSDVEMQYTYGFEDDAVLGYVIFTGTDLEEQEYLTVSYQVAFSGEKGKRQVVNKARATADNMQEPVAEEVEWQQVAGGLRAKKTSEAPSGSRVKKGDTITYRITVENTSQTETVNVLIKDKLPAHTKLLHTGLFEGETESGAQQMTIAGEKYLVFYVEKIEPGEVCERGFQVQVEEPKETDVIMNTAGIRVTRIAPSEVTEDTYRSGDFAYTNETVHFVDTLWVSTEHRVDILDAGIVLQPDGPGGGEPPKEPAVTEPPREGIAEPSPDKLQPGKRSETAAQKGTVGVNTGDETRLGLTLLSAAAAGVLLLFAAVARAGRKKDTSRYNRCKRRNRRRSFRR